MKNDTLDFDDAIDEALEDLIEIWTPGEIRDYIKQLGNKVDSFDRDVAANADCFGGVFLNNWHDYKIRFVEFAKNYEGWFSRLSLAPLRTAERFAEELRAFQNQFITNCQKQPSSPGIVIPKEEQKKEAAQFTGSIISTLATVLAIGLGGYFLFETIKKRR